MIFIVIDESEVSKKKYINIVVGDVDLPEKTSLFHNSVVEVVNQQIIAQKIHNVIRKLDTAKENFIFLLSDAAAYMIAAARISLKHF